MAKEKWIPTPFGTLTTIKELREFVDSWADKVTIPPRWIQQNLTWARGVLKERE